MDVWAMEKMLTGCYPGLWVGPVQGRGGLISWAPADRSPSPWAPEVVSVVMRGRAPDLGESGRLDTWHPGTSAVRLAQAEKGQSCPLKAVHLLQ